MAAVQLVKTNNFYNLIGAYNNHTYSQGTPSEWSNDADVDHGLNLITVNDKGTTSGGIFTRSGENRIFQAGLRGNCLDPERTNTLRYYEQNQLSVASYFSQRAENQSAINAGMLAKPEYFLQRFVPGTNYYTYNVEGLQIELSDDDTAISETSTNVDGNIIHCTTISCNNLGNKSEIRITIPNDVATPFTVRKICFLKDFKTNDGSYAYWYNDPQLLCLMMGVVLESPVVVAGGETFSFTFNCSVVANRG